MNPIAGSGSKFLPGPPPPQQENAFCQKTRTLAAGFFFFFFSQMHDINMFHEVVMALFS